MQSSAANNFVNRRANRDDEDDHQRAAGQPHRHRDARAHRRAGGLGSLQLWCIWTAIRCHINRGRSGAVAAISRMNYWRMLRAIAARKQQRISAEMPRFILFTGRG